MSFLSDQVADFMGRVAQLFGEGSKCLEATGYTKIIIEFLKKPVVVILQGRAYSLDTPSQEDINFCLGHTRAWLELALAEVRAEYCLSVSLQAP